MNCKEFLTILDYYCRGSLKPGEFVRELFDNIYVHPKSRPRSANPIETTSPSTFRGYLNGKSVGDFASQISSWLSADKFKKYMEGLLTEEISEWICEDLLVLDDFDSVFEVETKNIPDILAEQFEKIIRQASEDNKHYVSKDIERKNPVIKTEDVQLLNETDHLKCPICGKELILPGNSKRSAKQYRIVKIFDERLVSQPDLFSEIQPPENCEDDSNKIALCDSCAAEYIKKPTISFYNKLRERKKVLCKMNLVNSRISDLSLEDDIKKVLVSLAEINDQDELTDMDLNLHPLHLKDKITDVALLIEARDHVVHYFNYVQKVYSDLDCMKTGSDEIASDVGKAYRRVKENGLSQEETVEIMTDWILKKANLDTGNIKYRRAAQIIVSYYIQSCQVFENASSK